MRLEESRAISLHSELVGLYQRRNASMGILRSAFDGNFRKEVELSRAVLDDPTQDNKIIRYNLLNTAIRRYMDEMSSPLSIIGMPDGVERVDLELAERRQKLLTWILRRNKFTVVKMMAAYDQGLLDKAIFHVRPQPSTQEKIKVDLIVPETYLPVPETSKWLNRKAVFISFQLFTTPDLRRAGTLHHIDPSGDLPKQIQTGQDLIIEYWDDEDMQRFENGRETFHRRHNWGMLPFEEGHNIPIPARFQGQGDVDQALGLNRYLNELISDQADVLSYMANPIIVVRGSRVGSGQLKFGPRAIWELERDASADILSWPGSPPSFEAQIIRIMQAIEDTTGLSAPAFGREIPSGVSGETVRSILAGFNTRVGAKQELLGEAIQALLVKMQLILEREFPDEEFKVPGENGIIRPREFKGHYDVQVIWQPQNEQVRVFGELQKVDKGVQSRLTTMKRLGIVNPEEEMQLIEEEQQAELMAALARGGRLPPGFMPGQMPLRGQRRGGRMRPVQPMVESNLPDLLGQLEQSDPGTLAAAIGEEAAAAGAMTRLEEVDISDIRDALAESSPSGRIFVEGELAAEGSTGGRFVVRVQNEADVAEIRQALGALGGRADFRSIGDPTDTGQQRSIVSPRRRRRR